MNYADKLLNTLLHRLQFGLSSSSWINVLFIGFTWPTDSFLTIQTE